VSVIRLACIVEGHGDERAVPVLVRRVVNRLEPACAVQIESVIRTPKDRLLKPGDLERKIELAARKVAGRGGILVLVDCDDDCPAQMGPDLLRRARQMLGDLPIAVVLAKREFEAWFLAAARSLQGQRALAEDLEPPADPEAIRGAKEWLSARMPRGTRYVETLDQPALAACFDLDEARRADSFEKCYREITWLTAALRGRW
jgi:hypothetical protein